MLATLLVALCVASVAHAATLTLYPTNVDTTGGRTTQWTTLPTANTWATSLATNDGDTSYAHGVNAQNGTYPVFLLLDPTTRTTGTINSVTITALARPANGVTGAQMQLGIAGPTGAAVPEGTNWPVPAGTAYSTHTWVPATAPSGAAWSWSEIATLRAWAAQTRGANNGGDRSVRVTQLYVTVDYTPPTYTITSSAGANGSISPLGATSVTEGNNQSYTITANPGYYLETLTVDGSAVTPATAYTFTNVTGNHTISAAFAANNPTAAVTSPLPNAWIGGTSYAIAGTATADVGHVVNHVDVAIRRSDGLYWDGLLGWTINPTWLLATGTTSWTYSWGPLPAEEGAYTYSIDARATDDDAVQGTPAGIAGVRVDNVAPSGSVSIDGGAVYATSTGVNLTVSATDGGVGIWQMRFSNDGSTWSAWETYTTSKAWTLAGPDGTNTVYVQFRDVLPNASASFTDTIVLDMVAPTTTRIDSPAAPDGLAGWYVTQPVVTLTPSEAGATAYYGWDGAGLTPYLVPLTPAQGTHVLAYRSIDLAGNPGAIDSFTYKLDSIAPGSSVLSTTSVSPTSVGLSWTAATETGSGLSTYEVYDGAALVATTASTAATLGSLTPGSAHSYTVRALDVAGNAGAASAPLSVTTPLNAAPTTTLTRAPAAPNGGGGWYVSAPLLTLSSDPGAVIHYQWDSTLGSWSTYVGGLAAPSGTHTLYYYATLAGSSDEAVKNSGPISVDTAPPGTPAASASNVTATSVDLSWAAVADTESGVARYEVYDGAALVASPSGTSTTVSGLTPGSSHSYTVRAVDVAGNTGSPSAAVPVTTPLNGAPTTTLTKAPAAPNGANGWYVSTPVLTLDAGPGTTTYYQWDSAAGSWTTYAGGIAALSGTHTLYFYSVKAGSADESPKNSGPVSVDVAAPGTPSPSASNVAANSATISWPAVTDADSGVATYRVYDSVNNVVATTASTSTSLGGLTQSTAYSYTVRAFDAAGNQSGLSTPVTFTTAAVAQPFPYSVTVPAAGGSTSIQLDFSSVTTTPSTSAQQVAPRQTVPSANLVLVGSNYFDITADPVYTGFIEVTIPYSEAQLNGATESGLQMWHYKAGTGWQNVTLSVDTVNNTVTGRTTSFSDFAVYAPTGPQPPVSGVPASSPWSIVLLGAIGAVLLGGIRRRGLEHG